MKASLALNDRAQIALFYDEPLNSSPEWASIDIEQGEIYIGGADSGSTAIKLDKIDAGLYEKIKTESQILLILVKKDGAHEPLDAAFVPLMISQQF